MEAVITLISPLIVYALTNGIKRTQVVEKTPHRVAAVRALVAVLSLGVVLLTAWLTGGEVDQSQVSMNVEIILGFLFTGLGATGIHFGAKALKK